MSRLREHLRSATADRVSPVEVDWEHCEVSCIYVGGSINLQYRSRPRPGGERPCAVPKWGLFLTTRPPLPRTPEAEAALNEVLDLLSGDGWEPDDASGHP